MQNTKEQLSSLKNLSGGIWASMQSELRKRGKEIWEGKVKRNPVSLQALKKLPQVKKKKKQTIVLRNERIRRAQKKTEDS